MGYAPEDGEPSFTATDSPTPRIPQRHTVGSGSPFFPSFLTKFIVCLEHGSVRLSREILLEK